MNFVLDYTVTQLPLSEYFPLGLDFASTFHFESSELAPNVPPVLSLDHNGASCHSNFELHSLDDTLQLVDINGQE